MVETGLDSFLNKHHKKFRDLSLGVLCNQASVDRHLIHISKSLTSLRPKLNISCFFGPQHGIRGEKQDNMIESSDFIDSSTNLPVYSLYGKSREPSDLSCSEIDAFLIDLQDIGTRIYTFMYTMANCMRSAKKLSKKVIVLDRPNPIDGTHVEGNTLEAGFTSFVGQFPISTRHGMTMGELSLLFNEHFNINCDLEIIKLKGWNRKNVASSWGRDWVSPSPNIPTLDSAVVFPGTVAFEGTNVSEGRGTTHPFEWIGAPFINPDVLANEMNRMRLSGVYFRPIFFQPTFHKFKDELCGGVQVHVTNYDRFNSFKSGYRLLAKIKNLYPKHFQWKKPPYEYEYSKMPIDLIAGTASLRESIDRDSSLIEFERRVNRDLTKFKKIRSKYLLYK